MRNPSGRAWVAAALALGLVAGCGTTAPAKREADIRITRPERAAWNEPEETGLFRLEFGAALSAQILRRAATSPEASDRDTDHALLALVEEEGDREIRARGLCANGARLLSASPGPVAAPAVSAVFRCRGAGFF